MLTIKQKELLDFVANYINKNNVCPSYDEIKIAMNLKSKSGIHRIVSALEERGFIKRLANRARAIEVLRESSIEFQKETNNEKKISIYGKIAAGTPIEAISNIIATINIPEHLATSKGEHYALEVSGDSMVQKGIMDKDIVIIEKQNTAKKGNIVVALIRNEEATLKILEEKGKNIVLKPANDNYKSQSYNHTEVDIQGILVGLIRKY